MRLVFDFRLQEELVRNRLLSEPEFLKAWTRTVEPVYQLAEGERERNFVRIYEETFEKYHLGQDLEAILAEFPFTDTLKEILVIKASNSREEGVELSRDKSRLGIRLRSHRLQERGKLEPFLRHELMHIVDLLEPAFGYREEPLNEMGAADHSVIHRYRVLWDIYIDGRLARQGKKGEASEEERQRDFERLFSFLPWRERLGAFQGLWQASNLTHPQLWEIAQEPLKVVQLGNVQAEIPESPLPGALCPLCHFPTYNWIRPKEQIALLVRSEFPHWATEEGLCEHCHERYELKEVMR